jgi:hypothetical protein
VARIGGGFLGFLEFDDEPVEQLGLVARPRRRGVDRRRLAIGRASTSRRRRGNADLGDVGDGRRRAGGQ